MVPSIKFGASGWQARIADDFTFANVRLATEAIGAWVKRRSSEPAILVSYDTRFLSEQFARDISALLSLQNIRVKLCSQAAPAPAIAWTVANKEFDGAINVTGGDSPAQFSGLKFVTSDGTCALAEATWEIEREIEHLQASNWSFKGQLDTSRTESIDISTPYLHDLATKVDLKKIRDANISIGYDAMHGTGAGYLDRILNEHGIPAMLLHAHRDVNFGGLQPEPAEKQLGQLKLVMKKNWLHLGLATSADAERFGVLDEGADFIPPHSIMALLVDYLVESRGWKGAVARNAGTTHLIDRVARFHHLEVLETPIGFKDTAKFIQEGRVLLGGGGGGLLIQGHAPERDGILACLLVTEMLANRGKSLKSQLKELLSRMNDVYNHA